MADAKKSTTSEDLADVRARAELSEFRAKDMEAQVRFIEARMKLSDLQEKFRNRDRAVKGK